MYLGIDLGTSGVKLVLLDDRHRVVAAADAPLDVSHPQPLWSEQDPRSWWQALEHAITKLRTNASGPWSAVRAMGLSGQMHGAVVLDARQRVLRPAILWNDGRAFRECAELERAQPRSREITGNLAMPGFTAPKLLWLRRHEPDVFAQARTVLLPKDWLRLQLTGDAVSDMSDASGTLWLNVAARRWSEPMLEACGLSPDHMPKLVEGSAPSGVLRPAPWPGAASRFGRGRRRRRQRGQCSRRRRSPRGARFRVAWHFGRGLPGPRRVSAGAGAGGSCLRPRLAWPLAPCR